MVPVSVSYVDFNTIAMISCCVARHNLCRNCGGASLSHDDHDSIFGGKRVYLVCLAIWVVSFLTILPEVMGVSGGFALTGSPYGCDRVCPSEGCSNIGPFISIINNIFFMSLFYMVIVIKLCMKKQQVFGSERSDFMLMLKSISLTLSFLIAAYVAFLLPGVIVGWGLWPAKSTSLSYQAKAIIASIYWWMYGINFFIYLATSSRIRQAYRRFIRDMWEKILKISTEDKENIETENSIFWLRLRYLDFAITTTPAIEIDQSDPTETIANLNPNAPPFTHANGTASDNNQCEDQACQHPLPPQSYHNRCYSLPGTSSSNSQHQELHLTPQNLSEKVAELFKRLETIKKILAGTNIVVPTDNNLALDPPVSHSDVLWL